MSPLPEDQQLRWSVSPSGSKLDSLKHVFNLLSFQERSRAEVYTVKSPQQLYFIQWGIKAWLVWRWCEAAFFCCRCHEIELRLNRSSARYARNGAPSSIRHLIVGLLQTSKTRAAGLRVQKNLDGSKEHGLMFCFFFSHLFQPRARDHMEEGQRRALPQQSQDEVLQRRAGDPQLPAGRHGRIRVRGREQDGQEHGHRATGLLRYPNTPISCRQSFCYHHTAKQFHSSVPAFQLVTRKSCLL